MTELNQVYKCNVCGNIVEVLHTGAGELVCCGQPMRLKTENTEDAAEEKHVPVVEKLPADVCREGDGARVKVGSVPHPMEEDHYIEWIEIRTADGKVGKKFLKPGDKPEAEFHTRDNITGFREYCSLHGLWKA